MLDIYDVHSWSETDWEIQVAILGFWLVENQDYTKSLLNNPWF